MLPFGQILGHFEHRLNGLVHVRLHVVESGPSGNVGYGQNDLGSKERILDALANHLAAHVLVGLLQTLLYRVEREASALNERVIVALHVVGQKVEERAWQAFLASLRSIFAIALGRALVVLGVGAAQHLLVGLAHSLL